MRLIVLLALLGLFLAGCAGAPEGGVPKAAASKYAELSSKYSGGLGATLSNCMKGAARAYIVVGSGGFSGETFIYDAQGTLARSYSWDDMVEPGETPPPFDSSEYDCTVVNESKK
ncbi:MAG TPA: hypothetical protein VLD37_01485 [Candidatus Bilamarchaeum sp.]|nr:hypothetical protein [Candidatus Bilamarchaeum sp.]